jgi:hypothetical protein
MSIKPNQLVAALTPLVFAPLAGTISVFAAERLPGVDIDSGQLQQIFIAGALIAFGKAALWLKGWQEWEKREYAVPEDVANDVGLAATVDDDGSGAAAPGDADPDPDPGYEDEDDADYADGEQPDEDDEFAFAGRD